MSYTIFQTRAPMPSSNWTAENPLLAQFEEGQESDTGKVKRGPGFWNSLGYFSPSAGANAAPLQMVSTVVQTNVGTKQALLLAVPTGMQRIVTEVVGRNPSTSLAALFETESVSVGVTVESWGILEVGHLASSGGYEIYPAHAGENIAILAGEVFGMFFGNVSITATLTIDVFYYDIAA